MFDKLQLSQLSVGTDISEVRNQIDSIRQYLLTPSIQADFFELFIKKAKEYREQDREKSKLSLTEDAEESSEEDLKIDELFDKIPTNEEMREQLFSMVSFLSKGFINALVDAVQLRPMRVNLLQIFLVEMWYSVSNTNPKSIATLKIVDGKIHTEKANQVDISDERMKLLREDIGRRIHILHDIVFAFFDSDEDLNARQETLFNSNMPSTDSMFGLYFAFTLSQCSVYDIEDFLDYQKGLFHKNFSSFLSITLLKYRDVLTDEHQFLVKDWVTKNPYQPEVAKPIEVHQEAENIDLSEKEALNIEDYTPILGKLSPKQIIRFFDFLHEQKSKNGNPFMLKDKVSELLKQGFSIPIGEPTQRFTINLTEQEYWIIYTCFYEMWIANRLSKRNTKSDYANFLKIYFTNFDETDLTTIYHSLKDDFEDKMPFNILGDYLPERNKGKHK